MLKRRTFFGMIAAVAVAPIAAVIPKPKPAGLNLEELFEQLYKLHRTPVRYDDDLVFLTDRKGMELWSREYPKFCARYANNAQKS